MRPVSGWASMMRQTISIAPLSSRDAYGKPTYGSATSYRCRLVGKRTRVLNAQGQEVISNWTAYVMADVAIQPDVQVTLSTADVASTEAYAITPQLLSVGRYPANDGGFHHVTVHW